MRRHFLVVFLAVSFHFPVTLNAQDHEFGLVAGPAGYSGDLAPFASSLFKVGAKANDKLIAFDNLGINAFYKYHFSPQHRSFFVKNAGIRANVMYAKLSGGAVGPSERYNGPRRLHFFSDIIEISGVYELDFFRFTIAKKHNFSLYAFGGVGVVNYNPKGYLQNSTVDSKPEPLKIYETEGNLRKSTWSYTLPVGAGIKWKPNGPRNPWTFGLEVAARVTTDNLDDVHGAYPDFLNQPAASEAERTVRFLANPAASDPMAAQNVAGYARGNQYLFDVYKLLGIRISYTLFNCDCPTF